MLKRHSRLYDIVILGATGYTGRLTAEHVVARLPSDLKWAIAGRSEAKLQALADECANLNPSMAKPVDAEAWAQLDLEICSVDDDSQVASLVAKTALVITTVGPYCKHGEGVFRACAQAGTHYVDSTGEVPWVARMINKYENAAQGSGAIMIPQNGVESAAADLCTWAMVRTLRSELEAPTKDVVLSLHKSSFTPSGGTLATVLAVFDHFSYKELGALRKPYYLSPVPHPERARSASTILQSVFGIRGVPNLGIQTTSIMASVDSVTVERSWGLLSQIPARKNEFYGPSFTFAEYSKPRNWLHGIFIHWALIAGILSIGLLPPLRAIIRKFVYKPGEGISKEAMNKEEVQFHGTATPDLPSSSKQVFCRAYFRGSMYQLTALYLAQAALTILEDDAGLQGGVYTPACLGQGYVDRVGDAGFRIETKLLHL